MCFLKEENSALRKQIEAIQLAIELQKSESSLKAKQNSRAIHSLQMNVTLMTAMNAQQEKYLHELMQSTQPATFLEEAVQRCLKPTQREQSPTSKQKTNNRSIDPKSRSVKQNKAGSKNIEITFSCQDFRLKNPSLKINRITENSVDFSMKSATSTNDAFNKEFSKEDWDKELEEMQEDWEKEFELEDWDKEIAVFGPWKILMHMSTCLTNRSFWILFVCFVLVKKYKYIIFF